MENGLINDFVNPVIRIGQVFGKSDIGKSLIPLSAVVNNQQGQEEGLAISDIDLDQRLAVYPQCRPDHPWTPGQVSMDTPVPAYREGPILRGDLFDGDLRQIKVGMPR